MSAEQGERRLQFARNAALEDLLTELNGALGAAERALELPKSPLLPVVFIVGPPRSGTTLVMQWLAASGAFAWPSNLLSRFYGAPYLGARIQQLIADPRYNYRDELSHSEAGDFVSSLGKTKGLLQPNEFWYFWRRFFPVQWPAPLTPAQIANVDTAGFVAGLGAMQAAFNKPVAMKALLLQYNIALLARLLPHSIFLYTQREPIANADSLLRARQEFWGDTTQWYSVRPPGTDQLLDRSVHEQVAGQIVFTHRSIERELAALPENRKLPVAYESFCEAPGQTWSELSERIQSMGFERLPDHQSLQSFTQPVSALTVAERERWRDAFAEIQTSISNNPPD